MKSNIRFLLFLYSISLIMPLTAQKPAYISNIQSWIHDFYKYVRRDVRLSPTKKKSMHTIAIAAGTVVGIATLGTGYIYFFKQKKKGPLRSILKQEKQLPVIPLDEYTITIKEDVDDKNVIAKLANILKNKSPIIALKAALAANDINGIKQAIENNALSHSKAHKLLWKVQSADAAYYIVANYPGDKNKLLNYRKNDKTVLQHVITENNNLLLAEALVNVGANVHVSETDVCITPLVKAAENNQIQLFVQLIDRGARLKEHGESIRKHIVTHYGKKKQDFLNVVDQYKEQYPHAVHKIKAWANNENKVEINEKKNKFIEPTFAIEDEEQDDDSPIALVQESDEERKRDLLLK